MVVGVEVFLLYCANRNFDFDDTQEEFGWKLVHVRIFGGNRWKLNVLLTSLLCPRMVISDGGGV
uniref:Uncharacterized protein n=1 Tax=Tetranychus urticae TaxID=32264 RepID=T1KMY5_TETUR